MFLPYMVLIFHFKMLSAICFNLDQSKILSSGNGLINQELCSFQMLLNTDKSCNKIENVLKVGW